jgi:SOS regulatory protein LexA
MSELVINNNQGRRSKVELNKKQKKIINSKPNGHLLIKGEKGTGKTTAYVNKIPTLLNNYCIDKDDKILIEACNEEHSQYVSYIYENLDSRKYHQSSFFDEDTSNKLEINTIDSLILYYFNQYQEEHKIKILIASTQECEKQLKNAIKVIHKKYEKEKFDIFDSKYAQFIKEEITWIKSSNFIELDEYQKAYRKSRVNRLTGETKILRKNSKQRQAIYEILIEYNNNLKKINKIDLQDRAILALESAKENRTKYYTHIFIDNSERLTKVEFEFLRSLYNDKSYSSINFIFNSGEETNLEAWLINGRSFSSLGYDMKGKSITLTEYYMNETNVNQFNTIDLHKGKDVGNKVEADKCLTLNTIEYIDLKRNVSHKFIKDPDTIDNIYIERNGTEEKVENTLSIPVFNEIAAGSPILMNDSIEDNYILPKEWIRNSKDTFILKVKGDSMINRNIDDGDYVVIYKQPYPNVKDIVAVDIDGEATLKTYKNVDGHIVLMPENEKYSPIIIEDQQVNFLGVAIGIIKNT